MDIVIKANNVCKSFKIGREDYPVIKDVSFEIQRGDFVSIMGPSGSGKSTLLYMLGGFDQVTSGKIEVLGKNILGQSDRKQSISRRQDIGFIWQFYNLVPNLSVEENILLPALLDGKNRNDLKQKLDEILAIVDLAGKRRQKPRELSGGQQQRTAIARALINDPQIIFADEPIGNLDSKNGEQVLKLLQKINLEQKKTIVMVTHSAESAEYGNRVIYLKDGRINEK